MKKKSKRVKLSEPNVPSNYMLNNNALAPNNRAPNDRPTNPNSGLYPNANTPFPSAAGATGASPAGVSLQISQNPNESESSAFQTGVKASFQATGNSGTQIFGGYFSEEYLSTLRGRVGARKWDEMRRSEAQISMLMNAIMNPIKAANWDIEPADANDAEMLKHQALSKTCIFDMIDWDTFKHEALTLIPFGFSLMEVVHSVEHNHPKFGTFNGLKALSFRSQKTIENWQLENKTGRLLGVNQYTYSDLGGNEFIPGEFLLVFTHMKEGDNYEGISALRPMYGAYVRKELYLKLAAIGVERYAIGTPVGTIPKGKEKSKEVGEFTKILQNFTSHESSYITKAEGWTVEILKHDFDASKIKELLIFENTEFANAVVGNFLALGMNGGGGAYSLGSNLGEFFTSGIQAYADLICSVINRDLIPNIIKLNFGDQRAYPKMKCTGISDKAGKELAEAIKLLVDGRAIDPDKPLKEHLRKIYKLPKPDLETAVSLPEVPAGAASNYPKKNNPVVNPETDAVEPFNPNQLTADPFLEDQPATMKKLVESVSTIQLSDARYVKQFDANKERLKKMMLENLYELYTGLKDSIATRYRSLKGSDKMLTVTGLQTPNLNAYKAALRDCLSEIAVQSQAAARKSVPNKKNIELSEKEKPKYSPKLRKIIQARAGLIADTQAADMEKAVFFSFTANVTTSDDINEILHEVDSDVEDSVEAGSFGGSNVDAAAGDATAEITQESSMDFLTNPSVVDEIESFTFTNEDPISEICQSMVGTTVAPNDPILDDYATPLHHNCKSRWVPNLKGDSSNPDIGSGDAQENGKLNLSKKALSSITLSEWCRFKRKR